MNFTQNEVSAPADPVLRLKNIRKHYDMGESKVTALKQVNLRLDAGDFAALKGPSGSGKSTLLNICGLLDQANGGELAFLGQDVGAMNGTQLTRLRREHMGFVFQNYHLLPVLSARENVEYPLLLRGMDKKQRKARVAQMIEQVGLGEFAHHRPDHLSGGQRQRVAIARALVNRPRLVIADEPTANLDTRTATQMIELMHQLGKAQGTTFLIATHDERMAARCDRVFTIRDGEINETTAAASHEMA